MSRSLRIHLTAKPKSNSRLAMVSARLSICQHLRRALGYDTDHLSDIEPRLFGEVHAFRNALDDARGKRAQLIDHLRELAGPDIAHQRDRAPIVLHHRLRDGKRVGVSAHP